MWWTHGLDKYDWIDCHAESILMADRIEAGSMTRAQALELAKEDYAHAIRTEPTRAELSEAADSFSEAFEAFCASFE